jgi:hypothetical protein
VTAPRPRPRLLRGVAAALALVALGAGAAAGAKVKDFDELNVTLKLPDDTSPGAWDWEPVPQKLAEEHSAKAMAKRHPETLKDGKTPNEGHGARLLFCVQDVPAHVDPDHETWLRDLYLYEQEIAKNENLEQRDEALMAELNKKKEDVLEKLTASLVAIASKPEVQAALLHRFGDAGKGQAKVSGEGSVDGVPAAVVEIEATAPHLGGVPSKCIGKMLVWVLRKRLYRLAVWVWPVTKEGKVRDAEHFRSDLDYLEMNSIVIPKKEPIPRRPDDTGPEMPKAAGAAEKERGSPARQIDELGFAFRVTKPDGWAERILDRSKNEDRDMGFQIDSVATRAMDHCFVELLCYRIEAGGLAGFKAEDHFVRSFKTFILEHKAGPLTTQAFPVVSAKAPFLSLPDGKKRDVKRPEGDDDYTKSDLEKLAVIGDVKNAKVKEVKVRMAWRFCLQGVKSTGIPETLVQYVWSTDKITYLFRVTMRGGVLQQQGTQIKNVLSSFELLSE